VDRIPWEQSVGLIGMGEVFNNSIDAMSVQPIKLKLQTLISQ
jgi:hypothetical protein